VGVMPLNRVVGACPPLEERDVEAAGHDRVGVVPITTMRRLGSGRQM